MAEQQPPADKPEAASAKTEAAATPPKPNQAKGGKQDKGPEKQAKPDQAKDKAKAKPEAKGAKPAAAAPAKHGHRTRSWTAVLALLVALGSVGGGVYLWQQLNRIQQALDQSDQDSQVRVQALEQELARRAKALSQRQDATDQAQQELEHAVAGMHELASRDSQGWALAEAEFLMRVANARLRLSRDVPTAIAALSEADARLQALGDPALIGIREQLSRELAALKAVAIPDVEGMSLKLDALAQQADSLPLAGGRVPETAPHGEAAPGTSSEQAPAWRRAVSGIWGELKTLVVIRHHDKPIAPLLSPEQAELTRQVLRLKLETARAALVEGNAKLYSDSLNSAQDWLGQRFDAGAAAVTAVSKALSELAATDITPTLPDVSGSLRALVDYRRKHSAAAPAAATPATPAPTHDAPAAPEAPSAPAGGAGGK